MVKATSNKGKASTGTGPKGDSKATKAGKAKRGILLLAARVVAVASNPVVQLRHGLVTLDNPLNAAKQACLRALCNAIDEAGGEPVDCAMQLRHDFARLGGLHKAGSTEVFLGNASAEYSGYPRHELAGKHNPKPEAVKACADFAKLYMANMGTCILADGTEVSTKNDRTS